MRTASPAILALLVIVLAACGSSIESKVLGKWMSKETGAVIEFFNDGKLQFGNEGRSVAGSWSAVSDSRVKVEVSRGAQFPTDSFTMTLQDDDTLTTEAAGAKGTSFTRFK